MIEKICKKCNESKNTITDFRKKQQLKDGFDTVCKECRKEEEALYRDKNKERIRKNANRFYYKNNKRLREEWTRRKKQLKQKIQLLKTPCIVCGQDDLLLIDFHHLQDKKFTIASRNGSINNIEKEIEKCICLCIHCHRKYHKKRFSLLTDREIK